MAQRSAAVQPRPKPDESLNTSIHDQTEEQIAQRKISRPSDTNAEPKPQSVFSNLSHQVITNEHNSSLFNNTGITLPKTSTNLFGNLTTNTPAVNLFANSSSIFGSASTGLFSGLANKNGSDNKPPQGGLFSINFQAPKDDSEDEADDGGDDLVKASDDEAKEIIMKFEYKKNTTQIVKYGLIKFRKNQSDVLEKGSIAIEQVIDTENYVVIYRNNIQNILYQGVIYKGISTVGSLNQKKENLVVKLLNQNEDSKEKKEGSKSNQYQMDTVKLMFENIADAEGFKQEFEKLIKKESTKE